MIFPQVIGGLEAQGFKRLLLENADYHADPVSGGKLISLVETLGASGSSIITVKDGFNSTAEREPDLQPYWVWDIGKLENLTWEDVFSVDLIIELVTPTTSGSDACMWLGLASANVNTGFTNRGAFVGFVHSTVFVTDPRPSRFANNTVTFSTSGYAGAQHARAWMDSPENQICYSNNMGVRGADWSTGYAGDILSRLILAPATPATDPVNVAFTVGTMVNKALGSGANKSFDVRVWYKVNRTYPQ